MVRESSRGRPDCPRPVRRRWIGPRAAWIAWIALAALGSRSAAAEPAQPLVLSYDVTPDARLSVLTATLCVAPAPSALVPGDEGLGDFLAGATLIEGPGSPRPLRAQDDELELPERARGARACVRYAIDLARAAEDGAGGGVRPVGRDLVLSPDLWLWQPAEIPAAAAVRASLHLPPGIAASVPWPRDQAGGAAYRLGPTTFAWRGVMTLGRFEPLTIEAHGATVTVAILDGPLRASRSGIRRWLEAAVGAVAQLYGTFPVDQVEAIVQPVRGDGVQFGLVQRGGGASILFFLGQEAEDGGLPGEWVAVHELSHLVLPFVARDDAWLSEGMATYYQNVLRARARHMSAARAWEETLDGFERGRADDPRRSLAACTARMHRDQDYSRVYWAGAAIMMLADVELRRSSGGRRSLDRALAGLRGCCPDRTELFSAAELFQRLDRETGTHVFETLRRRWVGSTAFPEVGPVLRALGVKPASTEGGGARFDDQAPLAAIRDAIMAPRR